MWEIRWQMANSVHSKMLHLQGFTGFNINIRRCVLCVFESHKCLPIPWMCQKQTGVFHSSAGSEIVSPDAVNVWMDYQLVNLENVSWKHYPASQPRRTLSVTHAKESFRLTHILTIVFLSEFTTFHPSCQTVHTQLYLFDDNVASIQMINKGRSPNLRHVTRTLRVDLDWQFERE